MSLNPLGLIVDALAGGLLNWLETRTRSETERLRIRAARDRHQRTIAARIVTAGMQYRAFWIPWLIATVTLSAWFGWGMLDSLLLAGRLLPDVAALPPQLKEYADIAWQNVFYSGAGVAGAAAIAAAIRRR